MVPAKYLLPIVLFVLTVAAGFWVSKTGKPYHTGIFTLHKLLALAVVILSSILLIGLLKAFSVHNLIIGLVILAVISVIALFVTGALMSIQKTVDSAWLLIHRIAPFLLTGSVITAVLLITKINH